MNAPDRHHTPMVRLVLDLPAHIPLADLHAFAQAQGCVLTRTPQGVYRLRPNGRAAR